MLTSFVDYYTRLHGTAFRLERVLDETGSRPQPEALYIDGGTQAKLVIEHKTFVWPEDHFKIHRSGHDVSARIEDAIAPVLIEDRPYILQLPDDMRGSRAELEMFAASVTAVICRDIGKVHEGATLGRRSPGLWWIFREQAPDEREYYQPSRGLVVSFEGAWSALPPPDVTSQLSQTLNALLARVAPKFGDHRDARRVLVLDPHGEVRFTPDDEWEQLLSTANIPPNIDDIWLSFHDLIIDTVCGWMHQAVWPTLAAPHVIGCDSGDTV